MEVGPPQSFARMGYQLGHPLEEDARFRRAGV